MTAIRDYLSTTFPVLQRYFEYILAGAGFTLLLSVSAVCLGMVAGCLIALCRLSRRPAMRWAAATYVTFFRGTPLLVQLFLVYFGLPYLVGPIERWPAAIITLGLNSAAYIAEIVRAGIQSIDTGQRQAGMALGLSRFQVTRLIILPQAFRRTVPPLTNEFAAMLKDSSLVSVISLEELMRRAQIVVTRTFKPFEFYALAAVMYLLMTSLVAIVGARIEKALAVDSESSTHQTITHMEPRRTRRVEIR